MYGTKSSHRVASYLSSSAGCQKEFLIALSGSFDVVVDDGTDEKRYHMSRSYYGLYLPAMTWRSIDNFATNSMVLVLSSTDYDPDDYIRDFELFKQMKP